MTWLVDLYHDHGDALAATLREQFGVSLWDVGSQVRWVEGLALTRAALDDPATRLGAEVASLRYPASIAQMTIIAGLWGKSSRRVLPLDPDSSESAPTDELVVEAQEQLEQSITFTN